MYIAGPRDFVDVNVKIEIILSAWLCLRLLSPPQERAVVSLSSIFLEAYMLAFNRGSEIFDSWWYNVVYSHDYAGAVHDFFLARFPSLSKIHVIFIHNASLRSVEARYAYK